MINQAIILAGGKGTRLRSKVQDLPKPMADVNGKPFLSFMFDYLIKEGIQQVVLAVGYKADKIEDFYGDDYQRLKISYSLEEEPLGTGGAIAKANELIDGENVLVINGDTYFPIPLTIFFEKYEASTAEMAIALKEVPDTSRYGRVNISEEGQILGFEEKGKSGKGVINGGIYLFRKKLIEKYLDKGKFSFETEILQKQYQSGRFFGFPFDTYFMDIGIPEDYEQFQQDFE